MAQAQQQTPLAHQAALALSLVTPVRADHLRGAAAMAIDAPDLVDVEQPAAVRELQDRVAGDELAADGLDRRSDGRDGHAGAIGSRSGSRSPERSSYNQR